MSESRFSKSLIGLISLSILIFAGLATAIGVSPAVREALQIAPGSVSFLQAYFGLNIASTLIGWAVLPRLAERGIVPGLVRLGLFLLLYGLAAINLFLVGTLLFDWDTSRLWLLILLLTLPGVFGLAFRGMALPDDQIMADDAVTPASTPEPEKPRKGPAFEIPSTVMSGGVIDILYSILNVVLMISGFAAGGLIYALLRSVLFNGSQIDLGRALSITHRIDWTETGLYLIIVPAVLVIVFGTMTIGRALLLRINIRNRDRYLRDLPKQEADWLDDAIDEISDYAEAQRYPWQWGFAPFVIGLGGIMGGMAGFWALTYFSTKWLRQNIAHPDLNDAWYVSDFMGFGSILGIFAGIIIVWPITQWLAGQFPRFAEHLYIRHGWNRMNSAPRTPAVFAYELERDLRLDRISALERFEPAAYIQTSFHRRAKASLQVGVLAIAIPALFILADGFAYRIYDEDGIYQARYFAFQREFRPYEDAIGIETTCYIGRDDGDPVLRTGYTLIYADGDRYRLNDLVGPSRLNDLIALDERLTRAGIPHEAGRRGGVGQRVRPPLDPACLPKLEERFGGATDRVRRLLRVPLSETEQ